VARRDREAGIGPDPNDQRRELDVSAETDDAKGRVKEAAGALTGNDDLKQEGKTDQFGAKVKEKVEDAVDAIKDKLHHKD